MDPRKTAPEDILSRYKAVKDRFEQNYIAMHADARKAGVIDAKLGKQTYLEIGRRLIYQSYHERPTAEAVKTIYPGDPKRVADVGLSIFLTGPWDGQVLGWTNAATKEVGVVWSLLITVRDQLKKSGGIPPMSKDISLLKKIAYEKDDPVALRAWADIAWRSGRKEEALEILRHLAEITYPSHMAPRYHEDITFRGTYKAPWEALAEIYNHEKKFDESDKMMEIGALIYRSPSALLGYAYLKKEKGDWEAYEQCMVTVALSTDDSATAEACYRLANYYYLIHKGDIPSRDELAAQRNPVGATFSKLLGLSRSKQDWRKLAMDWYEAGSVCRYAPAMRNFAVLLREDRDYEAAAMVMERLKEHKDLWESRNIRKLRDSFKDPSFQPALPASWLEL